ncbi:hypothetical protein [Nitratifractor sp.]
MMTPSQQLALAVERSISKPLGSLKSPEALDAVLRRRLTKKEYKLFIAESEGDPLEPLMEKLRLDAERAEALRRSTRQKLNRDSIKRELYEAES